MNAGDAESKVFKNREAMEEALDVLVETISAAIREAGQCQNSAVMFGYHELASEIDKRADEMGMIRGYFNSLGILDLT